MKKIDKYIRFLSESVGEGDRKNLTKYEWTKDFVFTPEIIQELKKLDFLKITPKGEICVIVPVVRPEGTKTGPWNYPYDLLHISIAVNAKEKTVEIERYFGCMTDWTLVGHSEDHIDWTDIPVMTEKTVNSLIDMYNEHDVHAKLMDNLVYNAEQHKEYLDKYVGTEDKIRNNSKIYPNLQAALDRLADNRANRTSMYSAGFDNCKAIIDGSYKQFKWEWDYPSEPDEKFIKDRFEKHDAEAAKVAKELSDYYEKADREGRYTGD